MKQFFKFTFASVLGFIIANLLLLLIVALWVGAATATKDVVVEPNSVLKMSLSQPISDRTTTPDFQNIDPFNFDTEKKLGLNDIMKNIDKAAADDNIKGIYFNLSTMPTGFGLLEELRNKLVEFKARGKFIIAYSEVLSQKAYYIASVADKIYLNPEGFVMLKGFSAELQFLKGSLDKLGIEPQVFYVGDYKSATEPLRYTQMSDENREQTRDLLDGFYNEYITQVAESRGMSKDELHHIINQLKVQDAKSAKAQKVVDDTYYIDQVYADLRERLGIDDDEKIQFVGINKYDAVADPVKKKYKDNKIAVIYAEGGIEGGKGSEISIGSDKYAKIIEKVRKDEDVKAIVLRVNSGGGSALASEIIWRELDLAKRSGIPVVASMGSVAASGGYYISCNADTILADRNTVTGSIGVFGLMALADEFYNDKLGITFDTVKTTQFSDFPQSVLMNRELRPEEAAIIQKGVDDIYDLFLKRVADGRGMTVEQVHEIAQGRVWTGVQAKENGLIDVLGGVEDAIDIAQDMAGLVDEDFKVAQYPKTEDPFDKFIKELMGGKTSKSIVERELSQFEDLYQQYKLLQEFKNMDCVQMRLPYQIDIK